MMPRSKGSRAKLMFSPVGIARHVEALVDRVQIWPGLHLDDAVVGAIIEVEVGAVLQEGALGRDRLLVIQHSAEDEMAADVASGEAVVEPVGVLAVLV